MSSPDGREDGEIDDEEEQNENQVLYCICRKPDSNRFMIGCDLCEEWYHGDCIKITAEQAKKIKTYFCVRCREKDPSLEIEYKEKKTKPKKDPPPAFDTSLSRDPDYSQERAKSKYYDGSDDDEDYEDYQPRSGKPANKRPKGSSRQSKKDKPKAGAKRATKRKPASTQNEVKVKRAHRRATKDSQESILDGPRQCYGPGCIEMARKGSKYCSDQCGLKLASNRIYEILPRRLEEWQSQPSIADDFNQKALEKIRQEQLEAHGILKELDEKQAELERLIERGKQAPPLSEKEEEEYDEKQELEIEHVIYCVSCGHEINVKTAIRHMERCFNKYEAQTSYGSIFKTKIDNLFCDVFNSQQKTYCKRLRILCPEHSKDPKVGDDEVCGAPLYDNALEETEEHCRVYKKKCNRHFLWEKMRMAEIDMERVQQWLRIDDLYEREQKMRFSMTNRGGVLGLMLHSTIMVKPATATESSADVDVTS